MNQVSDIGKGTSSRRCGKTPSVDWFGVAQRFTAAISPLFSGIDGHISASLNASNSAV